MTARRPKPRPVRARLEVLEDRNAPAGLGGGPPLLLPPNTPDLTGVSLVTGHPTVAPGDAVTVRYTVRNQGPGPAGPFAVALSLATPDGSASAPLAGGRVAVPGLAAGTQTTLAVTVTVPRADQFPVGGPLLVTGTVDPDDNVLESDEGKNVGLTAPVAIVAAVPSTGTNTTPATAQDIPVFPATAGGTFTSVGDRRYYRVTLADSAVLTATAANAGLGLFTEAGQLIVRSEGPPAGRVAQFLFPGTYLIEASAAGSPGAFRLDVAVRAALDPATPLPAGPDARELSAAADLNGDGTTDFVAVSFQAGSFSVLFGNGDGSFAPAVTFPAPPGVFKVTAADVNADGVTDLITANLVNYAADPVSVLLGRGDGTFAPAVNYTVGAAPNAVAVADLNGDGVADLAVTNGLSDDVSVLFGTGGGAFGPAVAYPVGAGPARVTVADLNGDRVPDLVTANRTLGGVSVLFGTGGGAFAAAVDLPTGDGTAWVTVADLNRDGTPDLAATNSNSNTVSVLLGTGGGAFAPAVAYPTGAIPFEVAVADFDRDGIPDLATADFSGAGASVFLGRGDGTFDPAVRYPTGSGLSRVVVADLNGDGILDLAANGDAGKVAVLLGNGDGSFVVPAAFRVGNFGRTAAMGDLNRDGIPDLVTANGGAGDVSVLLGNGDGSFGPAASFRAGDRPNSVVVGDLNGDGVADLATAFGVSGGVFGGGSGAVAVLLGNGDGTFAPFVAYPAGSGANSVVMADFNRDGIPDLATANNGSGDVSVLLGRGDGTFRPAVAYRATDGAKMLAVGDVNGDRVPDLAAFGTFSLSVAVLLGKGDGTFGPPALTAVAGTENALILRDMNGDGRDDLVAPNPFTNVLTIRLSVVNGLFGPAESLDAGTNPFAAAVADLNGDGIPDLVTSNPVSNYVTVRLGEGGGTFSRLLTLFPVGASPTSVLVGDVNGDGVPDLTTVNIISGDASVLLGNGDGTFAPLLADVPPENRSTPHLGDFDHDGTPDVVVRTQGGLVLFRHGRPGLPGVYDAPVTLNPGRPVRDLVPIRTATGLAIAATESKAVRVPGEAVSYVVATYWFDGTGFRRAVAFEAGAKPGRIAAQDLDGDGLDDLVVGNTLGASVSVAFQTRPFTGVGPQRPPRSFGPAREVRVGTAPSDIAFVDLDGRDGPDIVVTNRRSGDVSVLYNDPAHEFAVTSRYRTGTAVPGAEGFFGDFRPVSREQPVAVAAGAFVPGGRPGVLVVSQGTHQLTYLAGTPAGGLTDPQARLSQLTNDGREIGDRPGQVVAADFDGDGVPDAAVLMSDLSEVWVYHGNGDGTFALRSRVAAGNDPTGVSAAFQGRTAPGTGRPVLDLLVGNGFGDVLTVLGNGDGTFRPFVRADRRVPFVAVTEPDGSVRMFLAEQANDAARELVVRPGATTFTPGAFRRDAADGLIGPGDVALADVTGDGLKDLIFANTGSNNVLVYPAVGRPVGPFLPGREPPSGGFAEQPLSFFTGTAPVALHLAELNDDNGDGRLDAADRLDLVVANEGSNDVSVLFGTGDGAAFRRGPRLDSGGSGPNAVTTLDVTGDGVADVVATNGQSRTLATVPGVGANGLGTGFFDTADRTVRVIAPAPVVQTQVVGPSTGFALTEAGGVTRFDPRTGATGEAIPPAAGVGAIRVDGGNLYAVTNGPNGQISGFGPDGRSLFAPVPVPAGVTDPSDLEVVPTVGVGFTVFLTDAVTELAFVVSIALLPGNVAVGPTGQVPSPAASSPASNPSGVGGLNPVVLGPDGPRELALGSRTDRPVVPGTGDRLELTQVGGSSDGSPGAAGAGRLALVATLVTTLGGGTGGEASEGGGEPEVFNTLTAFRAGGDGGGRDGLGAAGLDPEEAEDDGGPDDRPADGETLEQFLVGLGRALDKLSGPVGPGTDLGPAVGSWIVRAVRLAGWLFGRGPGDRPAETRGGEPPTGDEAAGSPAAETDETTTANAPTPAGLVEGVAQSVNDSVASDVSPGDGRAVVTGDVIHPTGEEPRVVPGVRPHAPGAALAGLVCLTSYLNLRRRAGRSRPRLGSRR